MRHLFLLSFSVVCFLIAPISLHGEDVDIVAIVPGCGDGIAEVGEACDGSDFDGKTCVSQGFSSGSLSCTAACELDTSSCVAGGGGGGGGGGGSSGGNGNATIVFEGRAYPGSTITILKDGQRVAKTVASSLANFQVTISGLSSGSYHFVLFSEDIHHQRSATLPYDVTLTRNVLTKIDGVFIAPTLSADKSEVRRGDPITFFGQSVPASTVTLEVQSPQQFFVQTPADVRGTYLHNFDTAVLVLGDHHTKSRSATSSEISPFSIEVPFKVGSKNVATVGTNACVKKADLNGDCTVNLIDFSIAAFWYRRTLSESFSVREAAQLNGDGVINIIDFSIMAFYWTG